jgi:putative transposase
MEDIAADMRERLRVMQQLMEPDVGAACGAEGKHNPDRAASRHGTEAGSVTPGGRRVPVRRPRVRAGDGTGEVALSAYELFNSTELLGKMAMERRRRGRRASRRSPGSSWR